MNHRPIRYAITPMVLLIVSGIAFGAPPRAFFSDLESGPNSGGQNNAGVFVTVYGARFGASRGASYVTVGGGRAATYPIWTDTKVTFQLGSAASTGDIVINTSAGASNGLHFTVRSGNIYFVAAGGSDGNNGTFARPWKTLLKARDSIRPGDTIYAMDGVSQTTDDGQGWSAAVLIRAGGAPGMPKALVAYPGATVTIGATDGVPYGIRVVDGTCPGFWVFAGLVLRGYTGALILSGPSSNWRVVGNDLSCPNGDGQVGCLSTGRSAYLQILGNNIHHAGRATASAHYHGLYLSTDSNHAEVAWNRVSYVRGCRGIQVHSSPLGPGGPADPTGHNMYDLSFHDNLIHDTQCDGIILATIDPSLGKVEVFNNIIYNAGQGPNNPENTGYWSCIMVNGSTANGSPGGGAVDIFHNTLYNCGTHTNPPYPNAVTAIGNGGNNTNLKIRIRNNIIYQPRGVPYVTIYGPADGVQGTNNLFFGNGAPSSNPNITQSLNADPQFENVAAHDFHLTAGSPARRAGVATSAAADQEGRARGGTSGYDLGALQFAAPVLTSMTCDPPVIRVPGTTSCVASLDERAPADGLELTATSDSQSVTLPGRIFVPAGFSSVRFSVDATALPARATVTLSAGNADSNLTVPLYLVPQGDTGPALLAVVNAASLLPGLAAPGSMVTAFGWNLGPGTGVVARTDDGYIHTGIAGVTAFFDELPAPMLYVQANQVNAVIPFGLAGRGDVNVVIDVGGRRSNPLPLMFSSRAPGVFTITGSGQGQAVALNEDGTFNSRSRPARKASVLTMYAAGLGETDPPGLDGAITADPPPAVNTAISLRFGDIAAQVLSAGATSRSVAGLYQIKASVPEGAPSGNAVPLLLTAGQTDSQPGVTVAIE